MLDKKEPKKIGWIRMGQQNGLKLSESNILLVGERGVPPSKEFSVDA